MRTNYGNANWLQPSDYNFGSGPLIANVYLKFDISSIPNTEIIVNGNLNLYTYDIYWNVKAVDMYTASNSWTEGTIDWNNQPGLGSFITSLINVKINGHNLVCQLLI